jgi:hypothetical protein
LLDECLQKNQEVKKKNLISPILNFSENPEQNSSLRHSGFSIADLEYHKRLLSRC